jgi:hypothetical protein
VLTGGVAPTPTHADLYGNTASGERVERGRQWV